MHRLFPQALSIANSAEFEQCLQLATLERCAEPMPQGTETAVMRTQCTEDALEFQAVEGRALRGRFDGGTLTSDGGAVLLREVERTTGILAQFAACSHDYRDPARVQHSVAALVRQRIYALALGYEDLNDHDARRRAAPRDARRSILAQATTARATRTSSSPRGRSPPSRRARCMKMSPAPVARWRTGSKSSR